MADEKLAQLIDTAIKREEDAYIFYMDLCDKVADQNAKETLSFLAQEEKKHRQFLVSYKEGGLAPKSLRMSDVTYYKIAEYMTEPDIKADMDRSSVFLLAAHRELRSHQFYNELAELHPEGDTQTMLLKMANEELKHKEKMEYLYANVTFAQTSGG